MYDLSENEKICQRKCNIPVQTGYFQSVFAEAQLEEPKLLTWYTQNAGY